MDGSEIRPLDDRDGAWVKRFCEAHWGASYVVTHGRTHELVGLPGFVALAGSERVGFAAFRLEKDVCELVALGAGRRGTGVGTALLRTVLDHAREQGRDRIRVITTNDNMEALRFFQKRGFALADIRRNALEESRKFKPEIPLLGKDGIPLRDEIVLERTL